MGPIFFPDPQENIPSLDRVGLAIPSKESLLSLKTRLGPPRTFSRIGLPHVT